MNGGTAVQLHHDSWQHPDNVFSWISHQDQKVTLRRSSTRRQAAIRDLPADRRHSANCRRDSEQEPRREFEPLLINRSEASREFSVGTIADIVDRTSLEVESAMMMTAIFGFRKISSFLGAVCCSSVVLALAIGAGWRVSSSLAAVRKCIPRVLSSVEILDVREGPPDARRWLYCATRESRCRASAKRLTKSFGKPDSPLTCRQKQ